MGCLAGVGKLSVHDGFILWKNSGKERRKKTTHTQVHVQEFKKAYFNTYLLVTWWYNTLNPQCSTTLQTGSVTMATELPIYPKLSHSLSNYINVQPIGSFNHVKGVKRSQRLKCVLWHFQKYKPISKKSWDVIHLSIFYTSFFLFRVMGGAGVHPSCHRRKGRVPPAGQ